MTETMGETLLIRADAGPYIGSGHVMRCRALAHAWQDAGGHAIFAMAMQSPALEARLRTEGMELIHLSTQPGSADDGRQVVDLTRRTEASVVVVDGYHFDAGYQRSIKDAGIRLLFIDDYGHADYYWADSVLNQNLFAHEGLYANRAPHTHLLLGTRYVLLRREFLKWLEWEREIPQVAHKVLVTLGDGDPDNVTSKVIRALQKAQTDGIEAVVVVGGNNPHGEALNLTVDKSRVPIHLKSDVTNMPELMAWADVAISAGGSTCWELAYMGLPSLVLILADHQAQAVRSLDAQGIVKSAGWFTESSADTLATWLDLLCVDIDLRMEMSVAGRKCVDGLGNQRIMKSLSCWLSALEIQDNLDG